MQPSRQHDGSRLVAMAEFPSDRYHYQATGCALDVTYLSPRDCVPFARKSVRRAAKHLGRQVRS